MSTISIPPAPAESPISPPPVIPRSGRRRPRVRLGRILAAIVLALILAAAVWGGLRAYRAITASKEIVVPTAVVQRGDITLSLTAKGELRGGNSEVLTAPLTGGSELHITTLRRGGEEVHSGDTVVQFDTTEQEYKLKEARADLAEAEQHLIQAKAQRDADAEADRYALSKAQSDIKLAELDVRKNPLLPTITARQNTLALEAAKDHLNQLQQNLANRKATAEAAIAMQEAGRGKAEAQAATAGQNIDAMTLKSHRAGYVSLKQNSSGNSFYYGQTLPLYQSGDSVRAGMAVAEIPDLSNWEIGATVGELDRGHIAIGEKVAISVIALPNQTFTGHVKELAGTSGPPWDRHFECKIALDHPVPELRPGMSVQIVVTTDQLHQVLWLPSQALFESDGRKFVYLKSGETFTPKDVTLVQRSETRVVLSGLKQGDVVALADPMEMAKQKASSNGGAMQSLPKAQ